MMKITNIHSRHIFDSRGLPTVEVDVVTEQGFGRASVPSGASTGSKEAMELRDGGKDYGGKGVAKALASISEIIAPQLTGQEVTGQSEIDEIMIELDGSENKANLGANAILAVSLAVAKAAAETLNQPLYQYLGGLSGNDSFSIPTPQINVINGGVHANNGLDIQEFMIVPQGDDIRNNLKMAAEIFQTLKSDIADRGYSTAVGDEGGFAPKLVGGNQEALELIANAIDKSGYILGEDIKLALDVAASELYQNNYYHLNRRLDEDLDSAAMIEWLKDLVQNFPFQSIEDPLDENDWESWSKIADELGRNMQIVGDDLLVTNPNLLQKGIETKAANAILIKPNQIGTLSETIETIKLAKSAGWNTIISHRSGETEDTTIAHLAVGLNTGQIKTGSMSRSERLAKYNELLRIAEETTTSN
ncbi:MAG: phosphopyruvate hydratase [Candidatus Saccharimonadales bacterium]